MSGRAKVLLGVAGVLVLLPVLVVGTWVLSLQNTSPVDEVRDVGSPSDISVGMGTLHLTQGSPARLRVVAGEGMRPWIMARVTDGRVLELGLADDSDIRVLALGLMPPVPKDGQLDWYLTVPDIRVLSVNDRGSAFADSIKGDSLALSSGGGGAAWLKGIDVERFSYQGASDQTGRVTVEGTATQQAIMPPGNGTFDASGLARGE